MKQIAQYQDGRLELQEVPAPQLVPGGILVQTEYSVISPGTEKMKVEQAKMNLLQKARSRPDQVRKVLDTARTLGWQAAYEKVKNRLETPTPLGYSACGEVIEVDAGNTRFRVGDIVAVGGAECAHHAEVLSIPDLLAAKVPEGVSSSDAAYTTLAAISMQAVRQSGATVGDRVLVIGQGLVGLLATSILRAAGARVLAIDLDEGRLMAARAMGAELAVNPANSDLQDQVRVWTDNFGVDAALVCTAASNVPVQQSVTALRDRGVLVIVGMTDAQLEWKSLYHKEIEVRYSRSYGPGRYDPSYEWGGSDYPIGYVRWTEQRNFDACLSLMQSGALNFHPVTSRVVPFTDSLDVYKALAMPGCPDIGVVLQYDPRLGPGMPAESTAQASASEATDAAATGGVRLSEAVECVDVAGAGNFVKTMLLPNLAGKVPLGTVITRTALSAAHVRKKFGFADASTDFSETVSQDGNRGLLIGTRHDLHAPMVMEGLAHGRHVFVEKPLCLTREQLGEIAAAERQSDGTVMVGFNRRFAPATQAIVDRLRATTGPITIAYHVFAGKLDPEHWYANYAESGGRILGEACHFLDYFCYLTKSKPLRVFAQPVWPLTGRLAFPDSVAAQVEFADGSSGQLIYTAEGDYSYPKEVLTIYASGLVVRCENFQKLSICEKRKEVRHKFKSKGHKEEMQAWADFILGSAPNPMPFEDVSQSMDLSFAVLESIREGRLVNL